MENIKKLVAAFALTVFSASASAIPLATVGSYDTLLASQTLTNSGSGTEEAWIEGVLGFDIDYTQLDGISEGSFWESVDGGVAGDYAFEFGAGLDPEYFLVKVGSGKGTAVDESHYLFSNSENMHWAFMNLSVFGEGVSLTNIGVISHVGITDGRTVPEPAVVGLLAMGLLGLVAVRRKARV